MRKFLVVALVVSVSLSFVSSVFAQAPGTLDPAFAHAGELGDSIIAPFKFSGLALSPGNEFVVSTASGDTIQVIRYTSNGARDINFGLNSTGFVRIITSGFLGSITTSVVQPDQKIVIGGQYTTSGSSKKSYLLRLNADGTVDNSFGTAGWVFFNFFPKYGETVHQVALQTDGKIVASDMGNNPGNTDTFAIVRLKANGKYDSTFASNGIYQIPFYNFLASSPNIFQLDASNDIAFAGYSNFAQGDFIYLFRLTANGVIDGAYGTNGSILIDSTNIINGGADLGLNFQADGKLITVQSKLTGSVLWAVCRYNVDGTPDLSFGPDQTGLVNVQPNLGPVPFSVKNIVFTPKNTILIAGIVNIAGANRMMINNFNLDGTVDGSFGNNSGSELLNCFEWDDRVYNLLIQPDGNILINGLVNESGYKLYNVVRLIGANPTAVETVAEAVQFSVYPNPANSQLHVQFSKPGNGTVSVKDITGKQVLVQSTGNALLQTIDISHLAAGMYIVTYQNGGIQSSKKIVKE